MDGPEVHTPHKAHTGVAWIDLVLGGTALLVSAISLYVAVEHGHTMEKLVAANSWPNVQFDTVIDGGNKNLNPPKGALRLGLTVANSGIGPARVESLEIFAAGKPVPDAAALIAAIKANGGPGARLTGFLEGASVSDGVLAPRENKLLIGLTTPDGGASGRALLVTAQSLQARLCFCSVFDECHVTNTRVRNGRAARVYSCPVPKVPYNENSSAVLLTKLTPGPAKAGAK